MLNIGTTALIVGIGLAAYCYLVVWVGKTLRKKNRNRTRARIIQMSSFPTENQYPVEEFYLTDAK